MSFLKTALLTDDLVALDALANKLEACAREHPEDAVARAALHAAWDLQAKLFAVNGGV